MKVNRKTEVKCQIPTASLPDIVFMLIFFFLVSTVLKTYSGLLVQIPSAESITKIESRRHTAFLWIDLSGKMQFNDSPVSADDSPSTLYLAAFQRCQSDPLTIASLKYDQGIRMELVSKANDELRKGGLLNVNFASKTKTK